MDVNLRGREGAEAEALMRDGSRSEAESSSGKEKVRVSLKS